MKFKLIIVILLLLSSCKDDDAKPSTETPNMPVPVAISGLTLSISSADFDATYASARNIIDGNPNIKIIAEVNHTENAASVDLELNPTRIIFFGNPNLGTPLMQKNQLAGLDLPQKIVAFQDSSNAVYLGFNATDYLEARHQLEGVETLPTINGALTNITTTATGGEIIVSPEAKVFTGDRITTKTSTRSFEDTYNTLKTILENNPNITIVAEVNHQENAENVGLELRPTRLVIFGNPNLGTPLMQNKVSTAIDLPQKMLVWEDEDGTVKVSYNSPGFLKSRHGIEENDMVLETIRTALDNISNMASGL